MLDLLHLYLVTFYKLSFRNATISAKVMTDRLSYSMIERWISSDLFSPQLRLSKLIIAHLA